MYAALIDRVGALLAGRTTLDDVAPGVHRLHFERGAAYRALSLARGVGPDVASWRELPPIPVAAFRTRDLRWFPAEDTVATFRTSGTTGAQQGEHHLFDLSLYRDAALRAFAPALLAGAVRPAVISLIPPAEDSSLARMASWVIEAFGGPGSAVDPSGAALERAHSPLVVLGTAFGLAAILEGRPALRLPPGSHIMETGGFKGRRREISRTALHALYARAGVPSTHVVGEYGMTELGSQWYDGVAGQATTPPEERIYRPPPWARTRVLDPATLTDVGEGDVGLLCHIDPVNVGSAQAVLTGDLGERRQDGFVFRGRATGAALRGCSLRDER